jgi:hypothetical protein
MHAGLNIDDLIAKKEAICCTSDGNFDYALLNSAAGIFAVFEIIISAGQDTQDRLVSRKA